MKEFRNPQDIHKPVGSYSHQIEINGNERLLVIAGQVRMRQDGTMPDDPFEQIDILPQSNIFFTSEAIERTYQELSERGIKSPVQSEKQHYQRWSMSEAREETRYALGQG